QFLVVDVVVPFRLREGLGEVHHWVPVTVVAFLRKDAPSSEVRGINLNERSPRHQPQRGGEHSFKCVKCRLAFHRPIPCTVLLRHVEQRSCNFGEVLDEASVEITKPEE
ncbi:hypothetical protein OF83DRAFT_1044452, partial [Amylostereum chailletii]